MIWLPQGIWEQRTELGHLPPGAAGDAALRLFCWPPLSERRPANHVQLADRARFHLRNARWERRPTPLGSLQVYVLEPDRQSTEDGCVLLIHGWTGEASFMTALAEPIRRAGHRVILFDLPAHGLSPGRATNLVECAHATLLVGEAYGPLKAIVAHSFGCMAGLLAMEGRSPMPRALAADRVVLVSSPDRLSDITGDFAAGLGMSDAARRAFERRLERIGHRPISGFACASLLRETGRPALVVHAPDDADVPFACAEAIVAANPGSELRSFPGLGHRNILFAPPVMRSVVGWLA